MHYIGHDKNIIIKKVNQLFYGLVLSEIRPECLFLTLNVHLYIGFVSVALQNNTELVREAAGGS